MVDEFSFLGSRDIAELSPINMLRSVAGYLIRPERKLLPGALRSRYHAMAADHHLLACNFQLPLFTDH